MQIAFYFDQTMCIGCGQCEIECQTEHHVDVSTRWRKVTTIEIGDVVANLSFACYHCAEPPCLQACQVGAITKMADNGIVLVDSDKCAAARRSLDCTGTPCRDVCPYGIPEFGTGDNAKMEKCDFCLDELMRGEKPRCVVICPVNALDAGPLERLATKYGGVKEALGFRYSTAAKPSAIFKPITIY